MIQSPETIFNYKVIQIWTNAATEVVNMSSYGMRHLRLGLLFALANALFAQNPLLDSIQVLGGSSNDNVVSITSDNNGNLYILGTTEIGPSSGPRCFRPQHPWRWQLTPVVLRTS